MSAESRSSFRFVAQMRMFLEPFSNPSTWQKTRPHTFRCCDTQSNGQKIAGEAKRKLPSTRRRQPGTHASYPAHFFPALSRATSVWIVFVLPRPSATDVGPPPSTQRSPRTHQNQEAKHAARQIGGLGYCCCFCCPPAQDEPDKTTAMTTLYSNMKDDGTVMYLGTVVSWDFSREVT